MSRTSEEWGRIGMRIPGWCEPPEDLPSSWLSCFHLLVPDPDHWAWHGWFLRLLGPGASVNATGGRVTVWIRVTGERYAGHGSNIGRACIETAEAIGRWPGGVK